jgi:hypothetical protein
MARTHFPDLEGRLTSVIGHSIQEFGRTGSHLDGAHQRSLAPIILDVRFRTIIEEELNKVKICRSRRVACIV